MDIQQPDPRDTSGWTTSLLRTAREAGVASGAPPSSRCSAWSWGSTCAHNWVWSGGGHHRYDYGTDLAIWARAADGTAMCTPAPHIVVVGKRFSEDCEKGQLESFCTQFLLVSTAQLQRT